MDVQSALDELEALAAKLDVQVVYEHFTGDGILTGGLCKVKGKWRVIIERRCGASERLSVLAQSLSRFDLENHFLSPPVRTVVDRFRPTPPQAPSSEAAASSASEAAVSAEATEPSEAVPTEAAEPSEAVSTEAAEPSEAVPTEAVEQA